MTDTLPPRDLARHAWVGHGAVAMIALLAGTMRWRLLAVPLQRDEGEYAYAGQLLLAGVAPYTEAYNLKLPGIYAAYAAVMAVFGASPTGIHAGLLVVNAITIVLVYRLGLALFGRLGGVAAAASFAFLSLGRAIQGVYANAGRAIMDYSVQSLNVTEVYSGERSVTNTGSMEGCPSENHVVEVRSFEVHPFKDRFYEVCSEE